MSFAALAREGERGCSVTGNNLLLRIASAAILLSIALFAAFAGGLVAGIVTAIFAVVVQLEWTNITGAAPGRAAPFVATVALAVVLTGLGFVAIAIGIALATAIVALIYDRGPWLAGGVIYAAAMGVGLVAIRAAPDFGFAAVIFVLSIVWATDTGAYFAGRAIGGPKLWPVISPKKTWAGAIGGLLVALILSFVVARLAAIPVTPTLMIVAIVLSIFCQLGDLFESWVKRRFGAKDSGSIIPGHGGVMDRVDGLTFAAMAAMAIGAGHRGLSDIGRGLLIW